jgi:hypothetical protein
MRLYCIVCEALARPVYCWAAKSANIVDIFLVERNLHKPEEIRSRLQAQIDAAEGRGYEALLLTFGLCGGATAGLETRAIPLVIPRAHDCITLYLGSRARYSQEVAKEPGTYWFAQDYMERNSGGTSALAMGQGAGTDVQPLYEHYVQKYGKAKADRLMEVMDGWLTQYKRAVYLDTNLNGDGKIEAQARSTAERRGWVYERLSADLDLIRRLLEGEWDEDFLVVPPGGKVEMAYDERIIGCVGV